MIKIFLTCRNRLEITKKCIHALKKHSKYKHQILIYDNSTNYRLSEHFGYFYKLLDNKLISQICFTSPESTFNAFSKASTCNLFGLQHEQDPRKNEYYFLLFLDNDMIVTPGWDEVLVKSWEDVKNKNLNNIKIISQLPGGIKSNKKLPYEIGGFQAHMGRLGGSAFWSVRPNFFSDVGFLDLKKLVNLNKKHDQHYWSLLAKSAKSGDYILGLKTKLALHASKMCGSVCNTLTGNKRVEDKMEMIKFEKQEEELAKISFDEFYEKIRKDKEILGW